MLFPGSKDRFMTAPELCDTSDPVEPYTLLPDT